MVAPTAQTSITVSWNTDSKVVAYKLEHALAGTPTPAWTVNENITPTPAAGPGATARTSYTVTTITTCATDYTFRVSGKGDGSASSYSTNYGATTTVTQSIPCRAPAPANVQPTPTSQTSITVSWDTDDKVTTYKLERAVAVTPTATPAWTQVAVVTPAPSSTTTSYTDSTLSCGTAYLYRVSAIGDGTDYSKFEYGDPSQPVTASTDHYCTPQDLTIIPMPQRKAELRWGAVAGATYTVQVRKPSGNWPTPIPGGTVPNEHDRGTSTSYEIKLDEVFNAGTVATPAPEGLAHATAYHLRVRAKVAGKDYYSKTITLRDSPIVRVNGHSPGTGANTGKAVVTWKPPSGATAYYVRWRKLNDGQDHSAETWQLDVNSFSADAFAPGTPTPTPLAVTSHDPSTMAHRINGLKRGTLYAIQLNYRTNAGWVFSARDAYVWPQSRAPFVSERVGSFPLTYPLPKSANGKFEYRYRICEDTFDSLKNSKQDWIDHINHAFKQWQLATDELVSMVHEAGGCADYSSYIKKIQERIHGKPDDKVKEHVENLLQKWRRSFAFQATRGLDRKWSEIIMIEDRNHPTDEVVSRVVDVFPEFADEIGLAPCDRGCAMYGGLLTTSTDIFLRQSYHDEDNGNRRAFIDISGGERIVFNKCPGNSPNYNRPYSTLVHEAGHALGIRGEFYKDDDDDHHPNRQIVSAIMSYGDAVPKCSPHPLDVMAIFALYQSR